MTLAAAIFLTGLLFLLAALPSASVALVASRTASHGLPDGIAVAAGIVIGDICFVLLALLGMSFVAETLGPFFVAIKFIAGAYLVYQGIRFLMAARQSAADRPAHRPSSLLVSCASGLFLTLADLKALLFYASLFPVVVDLHQLTLQGILLILSLTVVCVGGVKVAYACLVQRAGRYFMSDRHGPWVRRTTGGLLVGSGIYLAIKP